VARGKAASTERRVRGFLRTSPLLEGRGHRPSRIKRGKKNFLPAAERLLGGVYYQSRKQEKEILPERGGRQLRKKEEFLHGEALGEPFLLRKPTVMTGKVYGVGQGGPRTFLGEYSERCMTRWGHLGELLFYEREQHVLVVGEKAFLLHRYSTN